MKSFKLSLILVSFGLMCCSQKPKPVVQSEPQQIGSTKETAVSIKPDNSMEEHRRQIQALLEKAFQPVYFPFDKSSLSEESKSILTQAGDLMKQEPAIKVMIKGNTDERGAEDYNLALGDKRARAVKNYLGSYGVNPSQMEILSYGEEKPAKKGHDESAWALNRRDDFNVTF